MQTADDPTDDVGEHTGQLPALTIEVHDDIRSRLAIVLDRDDLVDASRLAATVRPWFGVAKVGLELYSAAGPDAVSTMADLGYDVFVDLKLHDIPTTVGRAARVLGSIGAHYVTIHTMGGLDMLRAGVEGLAQGAERAGLRTPVALGVTVLTSEAEAPGDVLAERTRLAIDAGCGGVICAVRDIPVIRPLGSDLVLYTPGIRMDGGSTHDQGRPATAREAWDAGADILGIGRAVTEADDPVLAAADLVESITT
jgi:orotidine-5'-phosphate decarboxylase